MKFPSVSNITNSIFPGVGNFLGGGASSSGGDSGAAAAADEARKAALRKRIDLLYGVGPSGSRPDPGAVPSGGGLFARLANDATRSNAEQGATAFDADAAAAGEARTAMDTERTQLSDATRQYYTDQLSRSFNQAERNTRFQLARQGLLGGSADVDKNAELQTDEALGSTRIDEAARRAAATLDTQREQERMNAISLVNSGAGESAVASAQAGLRNSLQNVSTASKANLFGDLFSTGANAVTASAQNDAIAAMLARYNQQLGSYFPAKSTSSGRITPGGG